MNNYDPCRKALEQLIRELETESLPWYEKAQSRCYYAWHISSVIIILAGFGTSLIAALMTEGAFKDYGKTVLIIVPALGALAATLRKEFRFDELEELRECGRIDMQDLIDWSKGQLAISQTEAQCLSVFESLREKVKVLEMTQHINSNKILKKKKK